jgi:prophage antirepressor-like protein
MAMKENTKLVIKYLQDNTDKDLTAADIAEVLGLEKKQVDGIFTSALQRKDLGVREEAEVELSDGSHQRVKFLRLTDEGLVIDVNAE